MADDVTEQLRAAARAAMPPIDGELAVDGLSSPVRVVRDRWGVPSISAQNLDDLFFAQGFVMASERLFQMDLAIRAANGRLSELFADLALSEDRFARTVGWNRAGRRIAAGYDDESRRITDAFQDGARTWLGQVRAAPVEYLVIGAEPSLPDDPAQWAACYSYLAWGLSGNWDLELLRAEIAERLGPEAVHLLYPHLPADPPGILAGKRGGRGWRLELLDAAPPRPAGRGSNNWVVGGARSASGAPMLANDPHLDPTQPGAWFEVHLRAPGYEARGVALPFSPGVIIGHTAHHAWGFTNVTGDVQDLYVEHLNEDRTAARYGDAWEPLTIHAEEISIRGAPAPEVLSVLETRHGPILDAYLVGELDPEVVEGELGEDYALRWTGHEHAQQPSMVLRVARARSFEEFREALRELACPGQNAVYADVDGHIGYQCTGLYPLRRQGDGALPVPGWTGAFEWSGWVPYEELPWALDPEEDYLATANNRVVDGTYPHFLGADFHTPSRVRRIAELIEGTERHTPATFAAMQSDTVSGPARALAELLLAAPTNGGERERAALEALASWDGDLAAHSTAAAIFQVWSAELARAVLLPVLGEELFARVITWRETVHVQVLPAMLAGGGHPWLSAEDRPGVLASTLTAALDRIGEELGQEMDAWRWGALHRVTFAEPVARVPGMAEPFTAAVLDLGGDETTVANTGFDAREGFPVSVIASWRQVVDLSDPVGADGSSGVVPTGQSGNLASPHWNDQVEDWRTGGHHPTPLRVPEGEAVEGDLTLVPAGYDP